MATSSCTSSGFATGEKFEGHGYRDNKHGFDYQVSQLILIGLRALKSGTHNFELGSDVRAADKWDDIVYRVPKDDGEGRWVTFIQVKHFSNPDKKISMKDLLESDGAFSLPKYFKSYFNIKRNGSPTDLLTSGDIIKDLIVLTNANFTDINDNFTLTTDNTLHEIFETLGEYPIVSNNAIGFKSMFNGKFELVLCLKRAIIDIPYQFALCVKNKRQFVYKAKAEHITEGELRRRYCLQLKSEILYGRYDKFSEKFILDENLSQVAKHFRDELYAIFQEERDKKPQETFTEYLERQTIMPPKFGNLDRDCEANTNDDCGDSAVVIGADSADRDGCLEDVVQDFLAKLKFVLKQADYPETVEMSMKELSLLNGLDENDPMTQIIYKLLRDEVNEWMGAKSANFLTANDLEMFLRDRRRLIKNSNKDYLTLFQSRFPFNVVGTALVFSVIPRLAWPFGRYLARLCAKMVPQVMSLCLSLSESLA
ncbi:uncharacterized protein LOC124162742 [Ischnura elegans]|uniref:uncharacterized protein LOC124162742 n=1 Tax=Ischnura elegans TaxID=197161 RepID=UPI001ED87C72|nr:uncharacterized protein LOC124162742 [Ischnura elegans]